MTNLGTHKAQVSAEDYLEHAKEMNAIAGQALRIDTRDATATAAKISLGLSLQAAELVGKGMLKVLGRSPDQIRREHAKHHILTLLKQVEHELRQRPEKELTDYHHFLLWTPTIDGVKYGNTVAAYLDLHFSRGASALPRSYFYPDESVFTGPNPIQALYVMVEHLIEVGENVVRLLRTRSGP
jgi:hypothetical protein